MRTPRPVLAACVLLAVTACDTSAAERDPAAGGAAPSAASLTNAAGDAVTRFGEKYRFRSGIVVSVSEPTSFQPSDAAYPESTEAITFEIWVRNETDHPYRLSNMAVTVTASGTESKQIIDPTQGYTGVVSSDHGLQPECEQQVDLAFTVPLRADQLKVTFQPQETRPADVTYVGVPPGANSR